MILYLYKYKYIYHTRIVRWLIIIFIVSSTCIKLVRVNFFICWVRHSLGNHFHSRFENNLDVPKLNYVLSTEIIRHLLQILFYIYHQLCGYRIFKKKPFICDEEIVLVNHYLVVFRLLFIMIDICLANNIFFSS